MFGMGMPEILLILAIALIVLGPKKLPEIAKSLGRGIAEFKKATQDFKQSIEVDNDFKEAKQTLQGIKKDVQETVRDSVAQGAASVDDDDHEDDFERAFEKDVKAPEPPQESSKDSATQAEEKAEQKEPSNNA